MNKTKGSGIGICYDYNPLTDTPPGDAGYRAGRTPTSEAGKLRNMWIGGNVFPLSFEQMMNQKPTEHYRMDFKTKDGQTAAGTVSAYEAVLKIAIGAGCSMQEAREAAEEIMPELWADFWEAQWAEKAKTAPAYVDCRLAEAT